MDKIYGQKKRASRILYMKEYRKREAPRLKEYKKDYQQRNVKIRCVHKKIELAMRAGILKKQPCYFCGNLKAMAHHWDYNKPLEVQWLCHSHHQTWHQIFKAEE